MQIASNDKSYDRREAPNREAGLLLRELNHRLANELATAVAAMRLAQHAGINGPKIPLFERAIARLEGFAQVHSVLTAAPRRTVDVEAEMHRLCRGLLSGRDGLDGSKVKLAVNPATVPGGPAHRLLLIAGELLHNGIRHALVNRGGRLDVEVRCDDARVFLTVSDDGPGLRANAASAGTRLGAGIVGELVRMGEGSLECDTGRHGTTFRVSLPLDGPSPVDWVSAETTA